MNPPVESVGSLWKHHYSSLRNTHDIYRITSRSPFTLSHTLCTTFREIVSRATQRAYFVSAWTLFERCSVESSVILESFLLHLWTRRELFFNTFQPGNSFFRHSSRPTNWLFDAILPQSDKTLSPLHIPLWKLSKKWKLGSPQQSSQSRGLYLPPVPHQGFRRITNPCFNTSVDRQTCTRTTMVHDSRVERS